MMNQIFKAGAYEMQNQNTGNLTTNIASQNIYRLSQQMYRHMRTYGYEFVDLPIIEPADLFLIKAGDQIVDRLFTFDHRGVELALRPEFTAAAAYHYATQYPNDAPVVRWQFSGYIFQDDPLLAKSSRQQFSIGAELFGMGGVLADAEIIAVAALGLSGQNVADYQVTLGHIGLLRSTLAYFQLDSRTEHFLLSYLQDLKNPSLGREYVVEQLEKLFLYTPLIDNSSTLGGEGDIQRVFDLMLETTGNVSAIGGRTRQDISRRLLQKHRRSLEKPQITSAIDFLTEWGQIIGTPEEAFAAVDTLIPASDDFSHQLLLEWKTLIDLLDTSGVSTDRIIIQPGLVRSWDYYSGIVFELTTPESIHLGGGGRYDELGKLLGAKQGVSAVGFAYYVEELIKAGSGLQEQKTHDLIVLTNEVSQSVAVQWANLLRQNGFDVQILPEDDSSRTSDSYIAAQENGTIHFKEQTYSFNHADILTNELKRIQQ